MEVKKSIKINPVNLHKNEAMKLLEDCRNGLFHNESYVPVSRTTPDIVIEKAKNHVKLEKLPIFMKVAKIRQMLEDEQEHLDGGSRFHGIDETTACQIIEGMFDPAYIVYQEKE